MKSWGSAALAPRTTRISIISIVWGPEIIEIIEIGGFVAFPSENPRFQLIEIIEIIEIGPISIISIISIVWGPEIIEIIEKLKSGPFQLFQLFQLIEILGSAA